MTSTMRAERFYADTKTVALEDIPIPEPGLAALRPGDRHLGRRLPDTHQHRRGGAAELAIAMRVRVQFHDVGPDLTLPCFTRER